jgi:site-specific recombinase XerD
MQYQTDASNVEEVIFKAAQALVVHQLLLQEIGLKKDDANEEAKINQLISENVVIPAASVEVCQRYYENNKPKFLDKERDETLPFALVENHIKEYLQNQSTTSGIKEYINILAVDANIKGFDFKDPSAMNIKIQ